MASEREYYNEVCAFMHNLEGRRVCGEKKREKFQSTLHRKQIRPIDNTW